MQQITGLNTESGPAPREETFVRRKAPVGALWLVYAGALAWAAAALGLMEVHSRRADREAFHARHGALAAQAAASLGDALAADDVLAGQSALRRLAGLPGARYAALLDGDGRTSAAAGTLPVPADDEVLARRAAASAGDAVFEDPGTRGALEFVRPVFVDGRRRGVLRWGVWSDALDAGRRRRLAGLAVLWAWAAGTGGVAVWLAARQFRLGAPAAAAEDSGRA